MRRDPAPMSVRLPQRSRGNAGALHPVTLALVTQSSSQGAEATDGDVVRAVLAGDHERYGVLVERYRRAFGRYAAGVLGDADAAADALQEAFIRAYDALANCREPDRFRNWFFSILSNQCRSMLSRRQAASDVTDMDVLARERADGPLERHELAEHLGRALDRLTPEQREAFVMKHVDGRSYEEMEQLLGVGVDALKMRVHRARESLRLFMGGLR